MEKSRAAQVSTASCTARCVSALSRWRARENSASSTGAGRPVPPAGRRFRAAVDEQLHQSAAGGGELEQRADAVFVARRRAVEQELQPAHQLAPAEQGDGVAERGDARGHAAAGRVGQAQQIEGERRLLLERLFHRAVVGVAAEQGEQAQEGEFGGLQPAPLDDQWAGEVVALEEFEAQGAAGFHLLHALDLLGQQGAAVGAQFGGERGQAFRGDAAQVDLDHFGQFEQRPALRR